MGEMKISIVMTYFERPVQLRNTLRSFIFHGYGPEVEVVIVDDGSIEAPAEKIVEPCDFKIRHIYMDPAEKWYCNPCIPFNVGFKAAAGKIVIIQNAECFHYDNIVEHALSNVHEDNYLTYACLSQTKDDFQSALSLSTFAELRESVKFIENAAIGDGVPGWYNHSRHNPRTLHFCSAIHSSSLESLGGFDERYALGICYDDDEFLYRITKAGFNPSIVDDHIVIHQWHYNKPNIDPRAGEKNARNKLLFQLITIKKTPFWYFITRYQATVFKYRVVAAIRRIPGLLRLYRSLKKKYV